MKQNSERARRAIILLGTVLVLDIGMILAGYMELSLYEKMQNGSDYTNDDIDQNELFVGIIALLFTIAYIISVVTFIMWFRRAYYNLHTKVYGLLYTEGWAAGAWFVPIINLFRPYQIMNELYSETSKLIKSETGKSIDTSKLSMIGIWWFVWVASNIFSNYVTKLSFRAETIEDYITSTQLNIISSFIGIPLALLAMKVVYNYSKMENMLYRISNDKTPEIKNIDLGNDHLLDDINFQD